MVWARLGENGYSHGGNGSRDWHKLFEGQFGKGSIPIKIPFSSEISLQRFFFSIDVSTHALKDMWPRIFIVVLLEKKYKK